MSGRDAGVVGGEERRRCARSRWRSRRRSAGSPCAAVTSRSTRRYAGMVEPHPAGALHDRLDDHRGQLVGVLPRPSRPARPRRPRRTSAGGGAGEHLRGQHARSTARACRRPGRTRSSGGRCRRGSRRARWPAGACSGRPAGALVLQAILTATSTPTEPESQRKTCSSPAGVISTSVVASSTAGSWVSPPNITWLIRPSWSVTRRVQHRVPVAVDRRPPRRHAVDQLPAVGQPQPDPLRRSRTTYGVAAPGHRPVRMPDVRPVERQQLRPASRVRAERLPTSATGAALGDRAGPAPARGR